MNGSSRLKDHVPPHSDEAEVATLGALLLNPEALATVLRYLRPDDFYKTANQRVFEAIIYLFDHNEAIDLITITERMKAGGLLDAVGGAAYISRLTSSVPTSANVEYYARIVQACSMRRNLVRIAAEMVSNAHDESQEARSVIEEAERQIFEITDRQLSGSFEPAKEIVTRTIEAIEKHLPPQGRVHRGAHRLHRPRRPHQRLPELRVHRHRRPPLGGEDRPGPDHGGQHGHRNRRSRWVSSPWKCPAWPSCSASSARRPASAPTACAPAC